MLVGAVGTGLDFFVFFFEREISLRESIRSILSWIVSFIFEVSTQCSLREAGFSRGVQGLLGQTVHVPKEGEERTKVLPRLDELADHVDGLLLARLEAAPLEKSPCWDDWVSRSCE